MAWSCWGWQRPVAGLGCPLSQMLHSLPPRELTLLDPAERGGNPDLPTHTWGTPLPLRGRPYAVSPPTTPSHPRTPSATPKGTHGVGVNTIGVCLWDHRGSFGAARGASGGGPQATQTPAFMEGVIAEDSHQRQVPGLFMYLFR